MLLPLASVDALDITEIEGPAHFFDPSESPSASHQSGRSSEPCRSVVRPQHPDFLGMANELRNQIYEHALSPLGHCHWVMTSRPELVGQYGYPCIEEEPGLVRVNRRIRGEVLLVFRHYAFPTDWIRRRDLERIPGELLYRHVRLPAVMYRLEEFRDSDMSIEEFVMRTTLAEAARLLDDMRVLVRFCLSEQGASIVRMMAPLDCSKGVRARYSWQRQLLLRVAELGMDLYQRQSVSHDEIDRALSEIVQWFGVTYICRSSRQLQ